MQATKSQVLMSLVAGVVLVIAGVGNIWQAFQADNADAWVGHGLVALATLTIGGLLVRAAISEIMDAMRI